MKLSSFVVRDKAAQDLDLDFGGRFGSDATRFGVQLYFLKECADFCICFEVRVEFSKPP